MLQPGKYLTQYAQLPVHLPLFTSKRITRCSQDYAKTKQTKQPNKKVMSRAVVLVFQHNPKELFRFMPLQNHDIRIYRLQRESARKVNVNIWGVSQTWELNAFCPTTVLTRTVLHVSCRSVIVGKPQLANVLSVMFSARWVSWKANTDTPQWISASSLCQPDPLPSAAQHYGR